MATYEDYDLPKSWPAVDTVQWLRATLDEAGVTSVELTKNSTGGVSARVWKGR
jgi:hypothetical protein